jgi:pimeloyl-ACP methyl ester carboxylesterase
MAMSVVLVHGNPETDAVWGPLRVELGRDDVIALSPPGFGAPVPEGFGATSDEYLAWLVDELERLDGPIDLIGHDWGGGHVMRLAIERPDLIRSWCIDIAGCFNHDYVWHDAAQGWQSPDGEAIVAAMAAASAADRIAGLAAMGMGETVAAEVVPAMDADMGRCILALYRSAAQPAMGDLGDRLAEASVNPGLVIIATEDHYTGGEALARRAAERAGAEVVLLEGLGHWWMCEDPARGAEALGNWLSSLD